MNTIPPFGETRKETVSQGGGFCLPVGTSAASREVIFNFRAAFCPSCGINQPGRIERLKQNANKSASH
jgi:hypothetical protein